MQEFFSANAQAKLQPVVSQRQCVLKTLYFVPSDIGIYISNKYCFNGSLCSTYRTSIDFTLRFARKNASLNLGSFSRDSRDPLVT